MPTAKTMNTTEASTALGVTTRTFRKMCDRYGITPYSSTANRVLYRQSDINRLIQKQQKLARTALGAVGNNAG